jgi:DNA polymerase-3 subunit epsilon
VIARWLPWLDRSLARAPQDGRWVVVDVETSGLDARRDALIAIGALGVSAGAIDIADSFEAVLRQPAPSAGRNIEVHGIGGTEQLDGEEPEEALRDFLRFVGADPLVAFHAPFDAMVLQRALGARLGERLRGPWLDLADVAPLAWPGRANGPGLDAWLEALGIPMANRHRAIVDCLGTAQLLIAVLHEAPRLGATSARRLLALSQGRRWLG